MELVADVEKQLSAENIAEEKKELITNVDFKMVTFSLAGKDYAIDIMRVKEIAKAGRFTFVPNTSHFVLGVYNLRGDIIPIIDLRLFFNIPIPERSGNEIENMIIVSIEEQTFGVVVDGIDKVVGIQKSLIQPPHPLFGDINIKYIYGVVENAGHLYILLDIERIFGAKVLAEEEVNENAEETKEVVGQQAIRQQPIKTVPPVAQQTSNAQVAKPASDPKQDPNFGFITDSLASFKKFYTSSVNEAWVFERFVSWGKEKGKTAQLQNEKDAEIFLKDFYSPCTSSFWSAEYSNAVYKALPENSAKQINVWNLGCGKGAETYSLACVLKKRYPESRIRIYAHDVDLISISNAPMLTVPENAVTDWLRPYLTKSVGGANAFAQEIKDMILFEYHDCMNTGSMPSSDIIFSRDVISFLPVQSQKVLIESFADQLKGNGIVILGKNETFGANGAWKEKNTGSIVVYTK